MATMNRTNTISLVSPASTRNITTPASIHAYEATAERARQNRAERAWQRAEQKAVHEKNTKARDIIILIALIATIALAGIFAHNISENSRFERVYELPRVEVIVHQGDTIDGIAAENPVAGLSTHELGYVISDINEDTHSTPLMPGDRLMIPVEEN